MRKKFCVKHQVEHPVKEFGINNRFPDGLSIYCRKANRERMSQARAYRRAQATIKKAMQKKAAKPSAEAKVERAIQLGFGTWRGLIKKTHLTEDEIGIALVELMFYKRSVRPRTINGERFYVRRAA